MRKFCVYLGQFILTYSLSSLPFSVGASVLKQPQSEFFDRISINIAADESAILTQNTQLLMTERTLANKIAIKLKVSIVPYKIPPSATPLERNHSLTSHSWQLFASIAKKVGVPYSTTFQGRQGADIAEIDHDYLLHNQEILRSILRHLGIPLDRAAELKGSFVEKNHTLLVDNGKALTKIAAKLRVK